MNKLDAFLGKDLQTDEVEIHKLNKEVVDFVFPLPWTTPTPPSIDIYKRTSLIKLIGMESYRRLCQNKAPSVHKPKKELIAKIRVDHLQNATVPTLKQAPATLSPLESARPSSEKLGFILPLEYFFDYRRVEKLATYVGTDIVFISRNYPKKSSHQHIVFSGLMDHLKDISMWKECTLVGFDPEKLIFQISWKSAGGENTAWKFPYEIMFPQELLSSLQNVIADAHNLRWTLEHDIALSRSADKLKTILTIDVQYHRSILENIFTAFKNSSTDQPRIFRQAMETLLDDVIKSDSKSFLMQNETFLEFANHYNFTSNMNFKSTHIIETGPVVADSKKAIYQAASIFINKPVVQFRSDLSLEVENMLTISDLTLFSCPFPRFNADDSNSKTSISAHSIQEEECLGDMVNPMVDNGTIYFLASDFIQAYSHLAAELKEQLKSTIPNTVFGLLQALMNSAGVNFKESYDILDTLNGNLKNLTAISGGAVSLAQKELFNQYGIFATIFAESQIIEPFNARLQKVFDNLRDRKVLCKLYIQFKDNEFVFDSEPDEVGPLIEQSILSCFKPVKIYLPYKTMSSKHKNHRLLSKLVEEHVEDSVQKANELLKALSHSLIPLVKNGTVTATLDHDVKFYLDYCQQNLQSLSKLENVVLTTKPVSLRGLFSIDFTPALESLMKLIRLKKKELMESVQNTMAQKVSVANLDLKLDC